MTISELIEHLEVLKGREGDIPVRVVCDGELDEIELVGTVTLQDGTKRVVIE